MTMLLCHEHGGRAVGTIEYYTSTYEYNVKSREYDCVRSKNNHSIYISLGRSMLAHPIVAEH